MDLNRAIIKITPLDGKLATVADFLQGLITNDINLLADQSVIYACLLNNKGRYLYDFFVIKYDNSYLIDIDAVDAHTFIQRLNFYKLLAKISLTILTDVRVYALTKEGQNNLNKLGLIYPDPRYKELPWRLMNIHLQKESEFEEYIIKLPQYTDIRYSLSIPQSPEMVKEKAIPIIYGMDELNALSYNKGCYLGQEFTNSAKHRLQINKRVTNFVISNSDMVVTNNKDEVSTYNNILSTLTVGDKIVTNADEEVGEVIGVSNNNIMAVIKIGFRNQQLSCKNIPLSIMFPKWAIVSS